MKQYFKESINIVFSYHVIVGLMALLNLYATGISNPYQIIIYIVLCIPYVYLYGRFTEIINNKQQSSFVIIMRKYMLNYVGTLLLMGVLVIPISFLLKNLISSNTIQFITKHGFERVIVKAITIYVFPILFLYEIKGGIALSEGVKYLFRDLRHNLLLILLILFWAIFQLSPYLLMHIKFMHILYVRYIVSLALFFVILIIEFLVFNIATMVLLNDSSIMMKPTEIK